MKKKLITAGVLLLSASLLVAASILGTLAFLASSSAVSNTFTYGEVGIRMLESKVDEDGKDADDDRTVDGNSYKLIPNKTYTKDPAITVTKGSVPSYLFVKVKNGISTIEKADGNTMKDQMIVNGWQAVKSNDAGEVLYLYVGAGNASADIVTDPATVNADPVGKADADEVIEIFKQFTVSEGAPVADYAGAKVTLTAFAIQTEGFTETTDGLVGYQLAWNAIVGRFPFESGTQFVAAGTP
ncbi:MAG: hypothetical protein IJP16_00735 [Clostridia bacterium]|nr:hypothetical protein [Clostridia bacterium]